MQAKLREFMAGLSFLTRLAPARIYSEKEMGCALLYFPLVGLVLGLVLLCPLWLGLAAGKPALQALYFVAGNAFLTRALHWDGWADLFDGMGSTRHGAEFFAVVKDSRIGVFGALALVLGVGAQLVAAFYCLQDGRLAPLLWAVVAGRCTVAPVVSLAGATTQSSLGRLMYTAFKPNMLWTALVCALLSGLLLAGFFAACLGFALALPGVLFLSRLAEREGGVNGDFFGAAIIWGELSALLAAALST